MSKIISGGITISRSEVQKFLCRRISQSAITCRYHRDISVKTKVVYKGSIDPQKWTQKMDTKWTQKWTLLASKIWRYILNKVRIQKLVTKPFLNTSLVFELS